MTRVGRESFPEKVTSDLGSEGSEGLSRAPGQLGNGGEGPFQAKKTVGAKALRQEHSWCTHGTTESPCGCRRSQGERLGGRTNVQGLVGPGMEFVCFLRRDRRSRGRV